ncbi:MAG: NAD-dependent epimerase/dehydratase family protein [Nocardioidaceae bacterium]
MRVLLTGSAGFVGRRVAMALNAAGHEVIGVDMMLAAAHGPDAATPDGTLRLDLRERDGVDVALSGVDVVCHQAAMVGNGVDMQDLPDYAGHNDLGTAVLLAAMDRVGVRRLVLASSMVVYGEGRYRCARHGEVAPSARRAEDLDAGVFDPRCPECDRLLAWEPVPEAAPVRPRSIYAASKVAQEHYADAWCTMTDARCVALRYHNVYGPGLPADTPYAGVAALFRSALGRGESPQVFEDGRQTRDFVHVDDVAAANIAAVESVAGHARRVTAYNICSGTPFTIGDMASVLAAAHHGPVPVVTGRYRAADVRHIVASPDTARAGLGFHARTRPEDGLAALASDRLRPTGR